MVDNYKRKYLLLQDGILTSHLEDPSMQPSARPKDVWDLSQVHFTPFRAQPRSRDELRPLILSFLDTNMLVYCFQDCQVHLIDSSEGAEFSTCVKWPRDAPSDHRFVLVTPKKNTYFFAASAEEA